MPERDVWDAESGRSLCGMYRPNLGQDGWVHCSGVLARDKVKEDSAVTGAPTTRIKG